MKTILALSLVAASFALLPTASAECVNTVCAETGSYGYGTCDNGYAQNYAYAYNSDANGFTYIGAGTYCFGYPGYYDGGEVYACYASYGASGYDYACVDWYGYDYFGSQYCGTYVYGSDLGTQNLGCPAGNPPAVPSLGLP